MWGTRRRQRAVSCMAGKSAWTQRGRGERDSATLSPLSSSPPSIGLVVSRSGTLSLGRGTCGKAYGSVTCVRQEGKRCDVRWRRRRRGGGAGDVAETAGPTGLSRAAAGAGCDRYAPASAKCTPWQCGLLLARVTCACRERGGAGGHPQHAVRAAPYSRVTCTAVSEETPKDIRNMYCGLRPSSAGEQDPATISSDSLKSRHRSLRNTPTFYARMSGITWPHFPHSARRSAHSLSHGLSLPASCCIHCVVVSVTGGVSVICTMASHSKWGLEDSRRERRRGGAMAVTGPWTEAVYFLRLSVVLLIHYLLLQCSYGWSFLAVSFHLQRELRVGGRHLFR